MKLRSKKDPIALTLEKHEVLPTKFSREFIIYVSRCASSGRTNKSASPIRIVG